MLDQCPLSTAASPGRVPSYYNTTIRSKSYAVEFLEYVDMENLNQAFTHINKAFSSTNHLFDRKTAVNPDVPPTEIVHVSNLDDVQSFLLAPMEVDETDSIPQSGAIPNQNLYVAPMTEELSRQVNEAITNSWRVDLYKDATPTAPEEKGLTLGLTQQESTWLKMLMKGPVLRSRARAIEDAAYVKSLDDSSAHLREDDRQLLEPLTPKQFYREADAFYGSESSTDEQDTEREVHARDDADEICLVNTSGNSPQKRIQMNTVDDNGPTSPFGCDLDHHLDAKARHDKDNINAEGIFEISQDSGVENDKGCSGREATKQNTSAEAVSRQGPHNEFDMCDEEPEYEPPESFDSLSPHRPDYSSGPFMSDSIGTFQHTTPELEISAQQTDQSMFWHDGYEPAILSFQDSEQPMDLATTEANIVPNTDIGADLQLEAELNASTNEYNTDSPGPYTRLLKCTLDYHTSTAHDMHCPEMRIQELTLGEPTLTSTNTKNTPILHSNRTPSPLKPTQPLTPKPPTTSNSRTTTFTTPTTLPTLLPKPLPHPPTQPTTTAHPAPLPTGISSPTTLTPTKPHPLTPKSKSVKAVFASPNLRSGPPSPIKANNNNNNNPDRDTRSKTPTNRTCAESAHRATATATDFAAADDGDDEGEGDTVHVRLPVSMSGRGLGVGLGLELEQMQMQMQPDSAIDVSFPAAEKGEEEEGAVARSVAVGKTSTKTKAKAKATTPKKKVGRPRKVKSAVENGSGCGLGGTDADGSGGGEKEKEGGVTRSPLRKRARKGVLGAVGGGGT